MKVPSWLQGDPGLLLGARAARSFIFGYMQVILAIYLSQAGFSAVEIGVLFTLEVFVTSLLMVLLSFLADRYGRKRILLLSGAFMMLMGLIYSFTTNFYALMIGAAFAGIRAGAVHTAFAPIEQALLAGKVTHQSRTTAFSAFSFVGSILTTLGALLSGMPEILRAIYGIPILDSYKPLFFLIIIGGVINILFVLKVKEEKTSTSVRPSIIPKKSSDKMLKFTVSGALDGLGAGFILPFFSYWFYLRFNVEPSSIGQIFAAGELLSALGLLIGAKMALKMGLVKATVLSRIPLIALTFALPFSPSFQWASGIFLIRFMVANMDLPLTQSYTMAVIDEKERASVASVVSMSKRLTTVVGPVPTGYMLQQALIFGPFAIASVFYMGSIGTYYLFFRKLKPPEEVSPKPQTQ